MKLTDGQKAEIFEAQHQYEEHIESLWEEMIWEFSMKYGLPEDEIEEAFRKYA